VHAATVVALLPKVTTSRVFISYGTCIEKKPWYSSLISKRCTRKKDTSHFIETGEDLVLGFSTFFGS
jgi:hypothetical protein